MDPTFGHARRWCVVHAKLALTSVHSPRNSTLKAQFSAVQEEGFSSTTDRPFHRRCCVLAAGLARGLSASVNEGREEGRRQQVSAGLIQMVGQQWLIDFCNSASKWYLCTIISNLVWSVSVAQAWCCWTTKLRAGLCSLPTLSPCAARLPSLASLLHQQPH